MATRLQQIVSQAVAAGATVAIPHSLNVNGVAVIPDYISRDNMGFTGVGATSATVTVRNDTGALATITLRLRYYHTIDRVYGNAATLQLTPAPFWDGGAAAITGAGALTEFVYQPGGTATGPMVFASFPALYAAMVAARTAGGGDIPIILGYDSSLGAVTVPAGTYSFVNVTEVGVGNGAPVAVSYADGTVFTGQRRWKNLIVTNLNTTTPPNTDAADGDNYFLDRAVLTTTTGVAVPFIRFGVGGTFTAWLENGSALGGGTSLGGTQTGRVAGITGAPVKHFQIVLDSSSQIVESTLVGGAGADLLITAASGAQVPVVAGWTSVAGNPQVNAPASFDSIPYLGAPTNGVLTLTHGSYGRINSTGGITQPLPDISAAATGLRGAGVPTVISNVTGGGDVTVTPGAGDTIMGAASYRLGDGLTAIFISDGVSRWQVVTTDIVVPQKLVSPKWDSTDTTSAVNNDEARAFVLGYAWRDFAVGESVRVSWRADSAGVAITWGEVALGVGSFTAGSTPAGVTPVGFTSIAAELATAATNYTTSVVLTNAIQRGQTLYGVIAAANTNTAPLVTAGIADATGSCLSVVNTTAGWRPSLQLGVQGVFAVDATLAIPKQVWST